MTSDPGPGKVIHFGARPRVVSDRLESTQPVSPGTLRIFVRDLVVPCRIGVFRHEQGGTQRVRINLDLLVSESDAAASDDPAKVVRYEKVADRIRALCTEQHIKLLETLAERIAAVSLEDSRVCAVTVRVEKLDIFDDAESAGVEIVRERPRP
ncbi:MAG: dihydroneopterin aldolase [Gemmatimonas sp.]